MAYIVVGNREISDIINEQNLLLWRTFLLETEKYQISSMSKFKRYSSYILIILASLSSVYVFYLNDIISGLVREISIPPNNRSSAGSDQEDNGAGAPANKKHAESILPRKNNTLHFFPQDPDPTTKSASNTSGNRQRTDDQSIPCQRYCPNRVNKIYYADAPAGLSDRKVILRDLSQLAGFLCAEVIMPPPKEHLSIDHNFGRPISDEMEWSDFVNITFIQDGSTSIKSAKTLEDGINITSWSNVPAFGLNSPKYKDWLHVVSTDGKMKDDFEVIQRFSFEQRQNATIGFVWEIHKKWYLSDIWLKKLPVLELEGRENVTQVYHKNMRPYLGTYSLKKKKCTQRRKMKRWVVCIPITPFHQSWP